MMLQGLGMSVVALNSVPDCELRRLSQLVFALPLPNQSSLCGRVWRVDGQDYLR